MKTKRQVPIVIVFLSMLLLSPGFAQTPTETRDELLHMMKLDQAVREEIAALTERLGINSPEVRNAAEKQMSIDKQNMARLEEIIAQYGWPTISTFGQEAATAAFLILQHSDLERQQKYMPAFRDAVEAGEARGSSFALLYDRVLMREGKKQLYGSQVRLDEATGGYYLWPVEDEKNLDNRRAALELLPMDEYLKLFPFEIGEVPEGVVAAPIGDSGTESYEAQNAGP